MKKSYRRTWLEEEGGFLCQKREKDSAQIFFFFRGLFRLADPAIFRLAPLCSALFYKDSLSDSSHGPACHSKRNNWKRTMKLYLHRNRVTCQRLQCRTPISFVFNQNEKFCWCRLFFCTQLMCVLGCACVCVSVRFIASCCLAFHSLSLSVH